RCFEHCAQRCLVCRQRAHHSNGHGGAQRVTPHQYAFWLHSTRQYPTEDQSSVCGDAFGCGCHLGRVCKASIIKSHHVKLELSSNSFVQRNTACHRTSASITMRVHHHHSIISKPGLLINDLCL